MSDVVLVERTEGVATITLNRPDRMNALSGETLDALGDACEKAASDDDVRCVVLTGAGDRAFCAGGDVKAMAEARSGNGAADGAGATTEDRVATIQRQQRQTSLLLHTMPKPTIARINGYAMGAGLSLALACDLRVLAASAQLGTAFAGVALSGDFGGSWFMTRLVGTAKARELYLLGERVSAAEAERLGLVNRVVDDGELDGAVGELAAKLAKGPTKTYGMMKENLTLAEHADLPTLLDREGRNQVASGTTADHREAAAAFVEKRAPNFTGR